jgi:hypothetical protein
VFPARICAFGESSGIVFREADPPSQQTASCVAELPRVNLYARSKAFAKMFFA